MTRTPEAAMVVAWLAVSMGALAGCDEEVAVDCTRRSVDACAGEPCVLLADETCRNRCEVADDCLASAPVCREEFVAPPEHEEFNPSPVLVCMPE